MVWVAVASAFHLRAGEAAAQIPVEPYQPLAGIQVPAQIPEKSRVLRHEEIWELPDTARIEVRGQVIYTKSLDETFEGPGGFRFTARAKFSSGHWIGAWSLVETWGEVAPADYPKLRAAEERAQELLNRKIPLLAAR